MKPVYERKAVCLQAKAGADDSNSSACSCGQARGLCIKPRGQLPDCSVVKPVSVRYVQTEKVRMHSLPDGDEIRHHRHANLSTEESYDVKEGGEGQCCLWLRQPSRKQGLQNDRGNQTDKCKGLADSHQQFCAI